MAAKRLAERLDAIERLLGEILLELQRPAREREQKRTEAERAKAERDARPRRELSPEQRAKARATADAALKRIFATERDDRIDQQIKRNQRKAQRKRR